MIKGLQTAMLDLGAPAKQTEAFATQSFYISVRKGWPLSFSSCLFTAEHHMASSSQSFIRVKSDVTEMLHFILTCLLLLLT